MASGGVVIDFTGNPAGAQRAFDKIQQQVTQLRAQLAGLNTTTKQGAAPLKAQNALLATAGRNIMGMVGAYASVYQGVRLISAEIRSQFETYQRMKEASLSLADVQISAVRNLGAARAEDRDKFLKDISAMAMETGITEKDLTARAGAVFSARQNLSYEQAMDAVLQSAKLIPEDAETGKTMAVAAINMAKKTGRPAEANLGLLKAIARTAQVVEWRDIAINVGPAVLAGMQAGMTAEESGAFWATMTHGREDPTGRRSKTSALKQLEQLEAMFPEEDVFEWVKGKSGEYERRLKTEGTGLKGDAVIQYIRDEHAKGNLMPYERYMAESSFQKGSRAVMREFLKPGTQIAEAYEFTKGEMPKPGAAAAEFRRDVGVMTGGPLQQTAVLDRAVTTLIEQIETADQEAARLAIIRGKFRPLLKDIGAGSAESWLMQAGAWAGPDEYRSFIATLRREQSLQARPQDLRTDAGAAGEEGTLVTTPFGGTARFVERDPTQVEAKRATALGQLIVIMEKMLELEEAGLKEQQKTNDRLRSQPAAANAAAAVAMEPR